MVEDDPTFREAVEVALRSQGHQVEGVACAREATRRARDCHFDLLLSDIRIEGDLDGVEGLAQVRQVLPGVRCILMTGFADADAPLRAARLKADDYLLKPFKLQVLLQSVQQVLERSSDQGLKVFPQHRDRALRWLYDQRLEQLEEERAQCLSQFFLLVRSQRLTLKEAYARFCEWERIELERFGQPGLENLSRLHQLYSGWKETLGASRSEAPPSERMSLQRFELLYARVQSGVLQLSHLQDAVRLLHFPEARRENLQAYCFYHWLWTDPPADSDPFLGTTIKGYRLLRYRSVFSPQVRLYDAEAEYRPRRGDRVLCLPDSQDWQPLMERELGSERATSLGVVQGHHFLLYQGYALSLKARLWGEILSPAQAWKILRPVFLQVQDYHRQGRFSGCFSLRDIDSPPGSACSLSHFSPAAYREAHAVLQDAQGLVTEFHAAPEVLFQAEPTARSDQAVLGRLLFEVIYGGHYPDPDLRVHIRLLGEAESNRAFAPYVAPLGALTPLFYRLAHSQPDQRFPSLSEAIARIDKTLANPGSGPPDRES